MVVLSRPQDHQGDGQGVCDQCYFPAMWRILPDMHSVRWGNHMKEQGEGKA